MDVDICRHTTTALKTGETSSIAQKDTSAPAPCNVRSTTVDRTTLVTAGRTTKHPAQALGGKDGMGDRRQLATEATAASRAAEQL